MGEFGEYLHFTQQESVKDAVFAEIDRIRQHKNVICIHPHIEESEGKIRARCEALVVGPPSSDLPRSLQVPLRGAPPLHIPIRMEIESDWPVAQGGVGMMIAERGTPTYTGTLGCVLKRSFDGARFALTCSHVALGGDSTNWDWRRPTPEKKIIRMGSDGMPSLLGAVTSAIRNETLDIALAGLQDPSIDNRFPGGLLSGFREVTQDDIEQKTRIFLRGARSVTEGIVAFLKSDPISIQYASGPSPQILSGLFVIGQLENGSWRTMSQGGDSGAAVFDQTGKVLGIVVAGSPKFTYVMPINPIMDELGMELD